MENVRVSKRNLTIDILRTVGLFLVILAHCGIPASLATFRQFDVVLLMMVSGMSFSLSNTRHRTSLGLAYVGRRFQRLVLPVWLFLCLYFVLFTVLGKSFSSGTILKSFALVSGIGYFWIFRVMFIASLTNPCCQKISVRFAPMAVLLLCIAVLGLNDWLYQSSILAIANQTLQDICKTALTFTVSYGAISLLGMLWLKTDRRFHLTTVGIFAALFLIIGLILHFPNLQEYRHPPMLYFISYGMTSAGILYELLVNITLAEGSRVQQMFVWLSSHSLTIYLWHVFAIGLSDYILPAEVSWPFYYLYVLTVALLCTWLQIRIENRVNHTEIGGQRQ